MSRLLTAEYLREVLDYDPETGIFVWRTASRRARIEKEAGCLNSKGNWMIRLDRRQHRAHRLAWLYVYEIMTPQQLDHINGNRADNRIVNLRVCDNSLNQQNLSLSGSGTTGYLGVTFDKKEKKFKARIKTQGVNKCLGLFSTALEASEAYLTAKKTMHTFQGWQP